MPRFKLTIAYDGTDFCGWQKQEPPSTLNIPASKIIAPYAAPAAPGADPAPAAPADAAPAITRHTLRTVQELVERACREVIREPVELVGASRTDAGVHARAQVAAFTCTDDAWPTRRGTTALVRALNSHLPDDILVTSAQETTPDFNPIGGATSKAYSYTLHVSPHRPLWDRRYIHHVWVPLDIARMQRAAAHLVGEHDFAAFAAAGHGRLSTVRKVFELRVTEEGTEARRHEGTEGRSAGADAEWATRLRIDIAGNGFLWNMVRIIAGTLVDVGRGRITPDDIPGILDSKDRRRAGPTLPPTGLCLEWIRY